MDRNNKKKSTRGPGQLPPEMMMNRDSTVYFGSIPLGRSPALVDDEDAEEVEIQKVVPHSPRIRDLRQSRFVPPSNNTVEQQRNITFSRDQVLGGVVEAEEVAELEVELGANQARYSTVQDDIQFKAVETPVIEVQEPYQIKVQRKKHRPKLERAVKTNEDGSEVELTYASKLHENIRLFFQYNQKGLVRDHVYVDESEKSKARTWVFILIAVQLIVSFIYAYAVTIWIPTKYTLGVIAGAMAFLFGIKLISLGIFGIRRIQRHFGQKEYDPESDDFDNIFICIPAYNEDIAAFSRTISSICNSVYPRNKMYMLFIVDGNRDKSFESLMEVLQDGKQFEEIVPYGVQRLEQGVYRGVNYSVYLKDFNRGKRDSQWLFVEIMRNMIPTFKPPFCFFVDSDTAFTPDSIRYLYQTIKADDDCAGVCGQLALSNFSLSAKSGLECLFSLSTMFVVGYQQYEYYYNQIIGKQCEAAYSSVTCLPGAFSMLRTSVLINIEARYDESEEQKEAKRATNEQGGEMDAMQFMYVNRVRNTLPLVLDDFFSKPTLGIIARNLYELGEDRTLTVKMLEKGLKTTYEPRAIAYTECPDTIGKLIQQRRRWNNSTFVNLVIMLLRPSLWLQFKTIPVMIFTCFDLFGSYFLPVNAILFVNQIWEPFFRDLFKSIDIGYVLDSKTFLAWWLVLQMIIMLTTKMPHNEIYFILSTFISGMCMMGSLYYMGRLIFVDVVRAFIADPAANWSVLVISYIFPFLHLIVSLTNPLMFFTMIFFLIMFPTVIITIPLNAFLRLDDFSWGTRD